MSEASPVSPSGHGRLPFCKISNACITDTTVSPDARLLYAIMSRHADAASRSGIVGMPRLAKDFGCSPQKIRRLLNELVAANWVVRRARYERLPDGTGVRRTTDEWTLLDAQDVTPPKAKRRQAYQAITVVPAAVMDFDGDVDW